MATTFPNEIQTFINKLNITASDAPNVALFQQYMEQGNLVEARNVLLSITDYAKKIVTAEDFNLIQDTCVALENYYLQRFSPAYVVSDTQPYIQEIGDYWFDTGVMF